MHVATAPPEVFEAFNELITENFSGGEAHVRQDAVVERILAKLPDVKSGMVFAKGWLNVEQAYQREGWVVTYDKPGYNESYEASFKFRQPRR